MQQLRIFKSFLPPKQRDVLWIKPLKRGFIAYVWELGQWQPQLLADDKGTLTVYDDSVLDPTSTSGYYEGPGVIDDEIATKQWILDQGFLTSYQRLKKINNQSLVGTGNITIASGVPGMNGKDGKDGIDGKDGKDGVDGRDGRDGIDGKDGINGTNGVDGRDGVDGVNGKSAYELAQDNGFTGTIEEWLASLKGEPGDSPHAVQSDWLEEDDSKASYIQHKPTIFSGSWEDLTNRPTFILTQNQYDSLLSEIASLKNRVVALEGGTIPDDPNPPVVDTLYWYVGTTKPAALSQATTVESYPAEQTYTNNSGAKAHIFALTNSNKSLVFISPSENSPVTQVAVDTTTIPGYKIYETAVGTANTKSIIIRIS